MADTSASHGVDLKSRAVIFTCTLAVFFVPLIVRLYHLQIADTTMYETRATQTIQRPIPIPAKRGEIYDTHFTYPLAINVDSFSLRINPAEVPSDRMIDLLGHLSQILEMPLPDLKEMVPPESYSSFQAIELKNNVPIEHIHLIAERLEDFPGVTWSRIPVRYYPEVGSLSHILGYVGMITQEELQVLFNVGYGFGSILGKSGLEKRYDQTLRGIDGIRYQVVDVRGRQVDLSTEQGIRPTLGKDLVLSIDNRIQILAEKSMGGRRGSVVVVRPATGEIVALVSLPYYDPNIFTQDNRSLKFQQLEADPNFPFLNRAIQSTYPPASTFKVVLTLAALDTGLINPKKKIFCSGSLRVGDRYFNCWRLSGHGPLNLAEALAMSCNVYFYTLGKDHLGVDKIYEYARQLGLGEISGIDLLGEISGIVPNPRWKQSTLGSPWVGGDTVNMSIGQGFTTVTPLQMANMVSVIVNEGRLYRPRLVKEMRDPMTREVLEKLEPELIFQSDLRPEVFREVQWYMRNTVMRGNAHLITTRAVTVGGKTGSAETGVGTDYHNWFASFGPFDAEDPMEKLVVVVLVEAQENVDYWAPKAANLIFHGAFANKTYEEVIQDLDVWYARGL